MPQVIRYYTGTINGTSSTIYTAAANKVAKVIISSIAPTAASVTINFKIGECVSERYAPSAYCTFDTTENIFNFQPNSTSNSLPGAGQRTYRAVSTPSSTTGTHTCIAQVEFYTKSLTITSSNGGNGHGITYSLIIIEEDCAN